MPIKLRCKRHFVLQTVDGPLVTVNPTPKSILPVSFKKAKTRSLAASQEAMGVAAAPSRSRTNPDGTTKAADPPPTTRHAGGGAVLEFAPIMPVPDSFGVPADDEELRKRERLGTVDRQACALCAHIFDASKLQFLVSRKAVVEQQTRWGRRELLGKDLTPANLYTSCRVCLFCYQFFEEQVQESSSVIQPSPQHHHNTSYPSHHGGGASSPFGSPTPSSYGRQNTIVLVNKTNKVAPRPSSASSPFGPSPTAQIHGVDNVTYQPVPDHLSAPEYVEELRIAQDHKRSQALLQCLSREWEVGERAVKAYVRRVNINDHRRREAARWSEEVARVRQSMKIAAAANSTTQTFVAALPSAMASSSILKGVGGGSAQPSLRSHDDSDLDNHNHNPQSYIVVPPSPSASPSMLAGEFSATGDDLLSMPLVVTLPDAHDGGGAGGQSITGDAAGSSVSDAAGSIGRRSRRAPSQATTTTTAANIDVPSLSAGHSANGIAIGLQNTSSHGVPPAGTSCSAARHHTHSSPVSARGVGPQGGGGSRSAGVLDFTVLELAEDNGEIELTDDLRAILSATPRSARSGGMHSSMNEPNAYLLARERIEASRRNAAAAGPRPGSAPPGRVVDFLHPTANKAQQLRMEAAAVARIRHAEDEYLRDCERRGMCPSTSRLSKFANQIMRVDTTMIRNAKKVHPLGAGDGVESHQRVLPDPSKQTLTLLQALRRQKSARRSTTDVLVLAQSDRQLVYSAAHDQQLFREDSAMYQNGSKKFAMYSL
jgi:hypothetical protein